MPTGLLFICTGNICRSPLAAGIFRDLALQRGMLDRFDIDSCGTGGWHAGEGADPRSVQIAAKHGLKLPHRARELDAESDFERFYWLIAMDHTHVRHLRGCGAPVERVHLVRAFEPRSRPPRDHELDVPDPYYGGDEGFQRVYDMLVISCTGLLEHVVKAKAP